MEDCFLCRKHNGGEAAPPGGYIYEDEHWRICHAPPKLGPLGTLFIESKRHFHSWLVPHRKDDTDKGMKFLARDDSCSEEDAIVLVNKLREAMYK